MEVTSLHFNSGSRRLRVLINIALRKLHERVRCVPYHQRFVAQRMTHGKSVAEAKALELKGWPYPRHLFRHRCSRRQYRGRDIAPLAIGLADDRHVPDISGEGGRGRRLVGYMEPYATSHRALDQDEAFQQEIINVARVLGNAVRLHRAGKLKDPGQGLVEPNPK